MPELSETRSRPCKYHPDRPATRIVGHGHGSVCEDCWALLVIGKDPEKAAAIQPPPPVKEAKKNMLDEKTVAAIKSDDGKLSLTEICDKHDVSWPTAKRYAPNSVSKKGKKPAGGGDTPRAKHVSKNGGSRFADTIATLREERERIDRVIVELEKM